MGKNRILIVEDNRIIAEEYKTNLLSLGYEVSAIVSSGDEALKQVEENLPDLVLMDVKLKGKMDGIEAANQIQTLFNIPVVYVTAYADKATLERIKKSQPYGFIYKPFDYNELHGVIQNALYKHQMEKRLKESEKWLSTTLRSIGDAVIATDRDGNVTFINPVAEELTGWEEKEAKGKPLKQVFKIINEITGKPAENPVERVLKEGIVVGLANHSVLINRKGKKIPIADSGAPIKDDRGEIIGVVLVFRDVTEKRMVERTRAQLAAIVESSDDAIIGKTLDGKIVSWNKGAEKIYGYKAEEVIGRSIAILVPPDHSDDFPEIIEKIKQGKHIAHYETKRMRKDGKEIDISLTISPIKDAAGRVVGASTIARDITERKKAEAKIVHLSDLLRAIRAVNQLITREKNEEKLLNRACEILAEVKGHDCVSVFYKDKSYKAGNKAELGRLEEFLNKEKIVIDRLRKITSRKFNGKYLAVSPIRKGEIKVVLCVIHSKPFDEEELSLLKEISGDIAFALHDIKSENKRKQMEKELRLERDKATKYLNIAGVMFVVVGRDQKITMINKKGCEILECEEEKCVGKNWFDNFIPERQRDEVKAVFEKLMVGEVGPVEHFENPVLTAKGSERIIAWHNTVLRDESGNIIGILGSGEDVTERKRAEEALKQSEEQFRSLFENAVLGLYRTTPDGQIILANPALVKMLGYSSFEELKERNLEKDGFAPGYSRSKFKEQIEKEGSIIGLESVWTRRDGSKLYVSESARVVRDSSGRILYYEGTVEDVTERKLAEKALKQSEERFRTAFNSSIIGKVVTRLDGYFQMVNDSFCRMLGYSKKEMLTKCIADITHPEDIESSRSNVKRLIEGKIKGDAFTMEKRYVRKDGSILIGIVYVSIVRDNQGKPLHMIAEVEDITERKQDEEVLRESEEKYRVVVEQSHDAIYIYQGDRFLFVNDTVCKITGYSKEELYKLNIWELIHPDDREKVMEIGRRRAKGEKVKSRYGARVLTKNGDVRDCEFSVNVISYKGKYAVLGAVRDITERRRVEKVRTAIYEISGAAIAAEDIHEFFQSVHNITGNLMNAENFYIALYDAESNRLSFPYFMDEYDKKPAPKKPGKGLTEYVLRTGQPLLATPEVLKELEDKGKIKCVWTPPIDWLGVPLKTKDKTIGVLAVQSYTKDVRFGEEEKNVLAFVSNQVALVIERKQTEEQIQKHLEERSVLLKEIHHRVKNNLQVIKSLLSLQSAYVKDKDDLEMFRESQNRIQSMALVHEKLYRSPDLARIEFGRYIEELSRALYRSYGIDPYKIRLNVKVEDIHIGIDFAVPCGLIINELVSNALKYAFPPSWKGTERVDIIVHSTEKGEIELTVRDNGIGFPKELDFRKTESLGLHLVHILAEEQLGGKIKLDRTRGTKFQIRFKSQEM